MQNCSRKILILLILLISFCGCSSKEDKKADHIKKGDNYFEVREYKKAEIEFKNALQIDDTDIQTRIKLGNTFLKLGQLNQAFSVFSAVEKNDPDNIEALENLAKFYFLAKKLVETQACIDRILEIESSNLDALFLKGKVLASRNQLDAAETVFEKILKLRDDHVESLQAIAAIKTKEQKFTEAEAFLQKAVSSAENTTLPRITLAQFYMNTKQQDKAEAQLNILTAEHPENVECQIILGNFYLQTNNREKAEAAYKKAIELQPDQSRPIIVLAGFYNLIGKKEKALELYRKACAINPIDMNNRIGLARFLFRNKKIDEAEKELIEIMNKRPGLASAILLKSEILISQKKYQDALVMLIDLEKSEPNDYRIHYFKGLCYIGLGDPTQAMASVEKAVGLKPTDTRANLLLADVYFHQRSFDLASTQASNILKKAPNMYNALLIRGNSQFAMGKTKEAEQDYQRMIDSQPGNPIGYFRMALLKSALKEYQQAERLLEKIYSINNKLMDVFSLRVRLNLLEKKFTQAHILCRDQLINMQADKHSQAAIYNIQATIFLAEKNIDNALNSYSKAIETDPEFLASYNSLAQIYLSQKNLSQAKAQYHKTLELNPNIAEPHMMLGTIYETEKNYSKAEEHFRKALSINPEFAAAANNLSYLLADKTNKYDEAMKYARIAKGKYPEDPGIMDTMGLVYYKKGLYGNAHEEFTDALTKEPDNPILHYHLGLVYEKKGDKILAAKELSRSLELDNNFPYADNAKRVLEHLK